MNKVVADSSSAVQFSSNKPVSYYVEVIDIAKHWQIVKRAKWSIIAVTLFCLIIGALIASSSVPMYRASTKIQADPQQPNANGNEQYIASKLVYLYYETQYEIINSRNLAETVVEKLGLVEKYKKSQKEKANKQVTGLSGTIKRLKSEVFALFLSPKHTEETAITNAYIKRKLSADIQENIKVSGGKQSQIINISYTSPDAQTAADIVNALSDAYIQFGLDARLGDVRKTESWLAEQSSILKEKLQDSEAALSAYRSQQGLVDTSQQQRIANTQLHSLNSELINAQTKLSSAKAQYLAVKDIDAASRDFYSLGPVLENKSTRDMVKEEALLSSKVNELFERYGEKHPKMIAARSELASAQTNLALEVRKVVQNIEKNYLLARVQVTNINKLIDETRDNIQSLQTENFSLVRLEREVENNRRIYENFQNSLMEASRKSEFTASNVQIIDRAMVPMLPFKPNIKLIMIIAGVFGVFFGVVFVLMQEALNNTFKTPASIEEKLKLPVLGITPVVNKKKGGAKPEKQYFDDIRSPFSESINTIRTGLLFSNIDKPPKTILVSSSGSNEGKSTLAANLAAAFSCIGKTLLLEVDLRKPSVANSLDIESSIGLTDLLSGIKVLGNDVVFRNNNGQFNVITCGTIARNPLELLSSQKFERLLLKLKQHFEYIILDGPPTLAISDSCILANKVDGVIFAIKAEDTRVDVAAESISRLQKGNAHIIGAVLTMAETNKMRYSGDHFYSDELYGVTPPKDY